MVSKTNSANRFNIATDTDLKKLFSGSTDLKSSITITDQIEIGEYEVKLSMVVPDTKRLAIQLAIEGKTQNGWYKMVQ